MNFNTDQTQLIDEDERSELMAEVTRQKFYFKKLHQHPSCFDPDHPGCDKCNPDSEEE
jgi:hypothetical protein